MDTDITYVGRGVKEDLRRINTTVLDGGCFRRVKNVVKKVSTVDLGVFGRERDAVDSGYAGLQRLVACTLREHLAKPADRTGAPQKQYSGCGCEFA